MPPDVPGAFSQHGWYFRRGSDASVTIWSGDGQEITFSPQTWASIVAAVSHHGEGNDSYLSARAFHIGPGLQRSA